MSDDGSNNEDVYKRWQYGVMEGKDEETTQRVLDFFRSLQI